MVLRTITLLSLLVAVVFANGETCSAPIEVTSFPFTDSGDTCAMEPSLTFCNFYQTEEGEQQGVWYKVKSEDTIMITASLCSDVTNFDTRLTVFAACSSDSVGDTCIEYNDDFCNEKSQITFVAQGGFWHWIFVAGYGDLCGTYELDIIEDETPVNQDCDNSILVSELPFVAEGDTTESPDIYEPCYDTHTGGMFYKIRGTGRTYLAHTCNSAVDFDTRIAVYTGCISNVATSCYAQNDDSCGMGSQVVFATEENINYYILVTGYNGARGFFILTIEEVEEKTHATCDQAFEITQLPYIHYDSTSYIPSSFSGCYGFNRKALWFLVHGDGHVFVATTCTENNYLADTVVEVYSSCDHHNASTCIARNDDYCGVHSLVSWPTLENEEYYIAVSGYHNDVSGVNFTLTVETEMSMQNDLCWYAEQVFLPQVITQSIYDVRETLAGACTSGSESRQGRWFYFNNQGPTTYITASSCNNATTFSTTIEVYSSCSMTNCVAKSTVVCGDKSEVSWSAQENHPYYIFVSGVDGATGYFRIEFYPSAASNASFCENAISIPSVPYSTTGDTITSTHITDNCFSSQKQGIWYSVRGTGNKMAAHTCNPETDYDTIIELHSGCGDSDTCLDFNDDYTQGDMNCGKSSKITWDSDFYALYYIYVTGFGSDVGVFMLDVLEESSPPHSQCSTPAEIYENPFESWGYTSYANPSGGDCYSGTRKGVWYHIYAADEFVEISTCSIETEFNTRIEVYQDCDFDNAVGTNCISDIVDDETCYPQSHVTWEARSDESGNPVSYYIFLTGEQDATGLYHIQVTKSSLFSSEEKGNGAAVAGAVIGALLGVAAIAVIGAGAFYFWHRQKKGYSQI